MPRLDQLRAMLDKQPNDPFLLYGAALEYKKAGELTAAVEHLDRCLAVDPNYCYAYYQKGQILEQQGDVEGAKAAYRLGVAAAERTSDAKAQGELGQALMFLD